MAADTIIGPLAAEYLRRVVERGLAERFQHVDVAGPLERIRLLTALHLLVRVGHVERVAVACGVWHYRLTPAGLAAAATGEPIKVPIPSRYRPEPKGNRRGPRNGPPMYKSPLRQRWEL